MVFLCTYDEISLFQQIIYPYISLPFVNSGVCQGLYNSLGAWQSLIYANANPWYLVLSGLKKITTKSAG